MYPRLFLAFLLFLASLQAIGQVDFTNAITIQDQGEFYDIAVGNYDGEGRDDIAYLTSNTVRVLLNRGNLDFDTVGVAGLKLGVGISAFTTGDLNNDGKSEILAYDNVRQSDDKIIVIKFVNGAFSFSRLSVAAGFISKAMKIDDYNGDGFNDIICATDSGPMQILEGSASGTFTQKQVDLGEPAYTLAVNDLNNDGKKDFIVTNYSGQVITYIAGGTSYTKTSYTGTGQHEAMVVADFSGDGFADVIASPTGKDNYEYYVNDGTGHLTSASAIPIAVKAGRSLAAGDYDNNGKADLVTVGYDGSRIYLFNNLGASFASPVVVGTGDLYNNKALFSDLDGDGTPEIVGLQIFKTLNIYKTQPVNYQKVKTFIGGVNAIDGFVTDLNNDSDADLIVRNVLIGRFSIYYGNGSPGWKDRIDFNVGDEISALQAEDFNGDGFKDLVYISSVSGSAKSWLMLSDAGEFSLPATQIASEAHGDLQTGDFNNDQKMDFITNVAVYLGNGSGAFSPVSYSLPYTPSQIAAGDFNGNNSVDFFITDHHTIHYYKNIGLASFSSQALVFEGKPTMIMTANIDGPGDHETDLIVADNDNKRISIISYVAPNSFATRTIQADFNVGYIDVADINKDGKPDIIAGVKSTPMGSESLRSLAVYLQGPNGEFSLYKEITPGNYPNVIILADVNKDHTADVVSISSSDPALRVIVSELIDEPHIVSTDIQTYAGARTSNTTFTKGNGKGRIVLLREGSLVNAKPEDDVVYISNGRFKAGNKIGADNYVVYAGSDESSFKITGLKEATVYHGKIFEFNSSANAGVINYEFSGSQFAFTTKTAQHVAIEPMSLKKDADTLTVIYSSSGLKVKLQTNSSTATIKGDTILISGPGPITVVASNPGNAVYDVLADTAITFCVKPVKPTITAEENNNGVTLMSSSADHNTWYKSGTAVANATAQQLSVTKSGEYTVKVDFGGCSTTSDIYSLTVLGIEESLQQSVSVYPNPATSQLRISSHEDIRHVKMFDSRGKCVYTAHGDGKDHDLSFTALPNGLFYITVEVSRGNVTKKIVHE